MGIWIRTLGVVLAAPFRPRLDLFGVSRRHFRVMPGDLDYNVHMNNARYLALMDLGRIDLILRTGMWRAMWRNHWQAVLAGSLVRYRRPLKPFQKFTLTSKLIGWDEKWFYIEHRVDAAGVLACRSVVRGAFLGADGIVPPSRLAKALGANAGDASLPAWVTAWGDADRGMDQTPFIAMAGA